MTRVADPVAHLPSPPFALSHSDGPPPEDLVPPFSPEHADEARERHGDQGDAAVTTP